MRRFFVIFLITFLFIWQSAARSAFAAPIVIDHTSVDQFNSIPDVYITAARNLRLYWMHASTGGYISQGLDRLAASNSEYNRSNWVDVFYNPSCSDPSCKTDQFYNWAIQGMNNYDVGMMKFCFDDAGQMAPPDPDQFLYYTSKMSQIEAQYPSPKHIVLWTGALMAWWAGSNDASCALQNNFNQKLRSYTLANGQILFDLADIESYHEDGTRCYSGGCPGMCCEYTGDGSCTSGQDGGHPNIVGSDRLAKAIWVMMAKIAGWGGGGITPAPTVTVSATPTIIPTTTPTPVPGNEINIALTGSGYKWWGNVNAPLANTNRGAAAELADNVNGTDVDLYGGIGMDDVLNAYEAAGVIWISPQNNIDKVEFINGSSDNPNNPSVANGNFTADFQLQSSADGVNWTAVPWHGSTPVYPYSASASDQTYTFSGSALEGVRGMRVVGQVHTSASGSWNAHAKQVKVYASVLSGDANGDGQVDGIDYVIWLNHYGQTLTGGAGVGDFNGNGYIDGVDYVIWLNNYGK